MGAFLRQEAPVFFALSQTLVPEVNIDDCVRVLSFIDGPVYDVLRAKVF
jgi:hypothetical protein